VLVQATAGPASSAHEKVDPGVLEMKRKAAVCWLVRLAGVEAMATIGRSGGGGIAG